MVLLGWTIDQTAPEESLSACSLHKATEDGICAEPVSLTEAIR